MTLLILCMFAGVPAHHVQHHKAKADSFVVHSAKSCNECFKEQLGCTKLRQTKDTSWVCVHDHE